MQKFRMREISIDTPRPWYGLACSDPPRTRPRSRRRRRQAASARPRSPALLLPPAARSAHEPAGRLLCSYGKHQVPEEAQHPEREAASAQRRDQERHEDLDEEGSDGRRVGRRRGSHHRAAGGRTCAGQGGEPRDLAQEDGGAPQEPLGQDRERGGGLSYAAMAAINTGITTSPGAPDFNARSVSAMRSWIATNSPSEELRACCWYRRACQSNRRPACFATCAGGVRSGNARTRIRSRTRTAMPPRTMSASSPFSSIARRARIAPARSLPKARSQRSHVFCSPKPRN